MENKFITANMCGGLGNQLFQIGMVYCLSWEYDKQPVIKKIKSSPSIFNHRPVYWNNVFHKVNTVDDEKFNSISFEQMKENFELEYKLSSDKSYLLDGYFQYPFYLNKYREKIIDLFSLPEDLMKSIKTKYQMINPDRLPSVAVHVRRGDYLQLQHFHVVQPIEYFQSGIKSFSDEHLFIVFSDDIKWCQDHIKAKNIYFVSYIDAIDQLQQDVFELFLMSLCDHQIISNSSFSWWGYWLNTNPDKKLIHPMRWFAVEPDNTRYMRLLFSK